MKKTKRYLILSVVVLIAVSGCISSDTDTDTPSPTSPEPTPTSQPDSTSDSQEETDTESTEPSELTGIEVTRVVDGDTIEVEYSNGTKDTIRLIGVDTPEVHTENSPDEFEGIPDTIQGSDCLRGWGDNASDYAETVLSGETVRLETDPNLDKRGYYGRLLAYVYVEDSGESFNYQLIKNSYARVYDSDFSRQDKYYEAESEAQNSKTGLWACTVSTQESQQQDRIVTDGGTDTSTSLKIVEIHADAEGNDHENLNDEYIVLRNNGDNSVDLSGWTIQDEADHSYTIPTGFVLDSGDEVTIRTGSGSDTSSTLYWDSGSAVWNNGGDTITVTDSGGNVVVEESY
ncbi:lamin tail domain-containing protein (plasmid) [Halorutilales archaeon Cl-col2-1]